MLDTLLEERSCRALLVVARSSRDPHLAPFAGTAKLGPSFVVAPRGAPARLGFLTPMDRQEAAASGLALLTPEALDVARWVRGGASPGTILAGMVARALHLCELAPGRLALAGRWDAGEVHEACEILTAEGWSFASGEPLVYLLRKTKTPAELAEMRRVALGTRAAFERVARLLAGATTIDGELWLDGGPLTVRRVKGAVAAALAAHELEQPEGGICAAGGEGAVPHTSGTPERVLRPGESLILDLYPRGRLFVDCTRTFCVGEPPEPLRAAHASVREALELARAHARTGRRAWDLQEMVCEHLARAGYPTPISDPETERGYVHGLGHGVGLDVHEYPIFRENAGEAEGRLAAGDVFALEPGLYEGEAGWAVRLEDLYHLGPLGPESLVPLPYAMDPRAWVAADPAS